MSWLINKGLKLVGVWKWYAILGIVLVGLVGVVAWQRDQINKKNAALIVASEQLRQASAAIRTRDSLIFSTAQDGGRTFTAQEKQCHAAILEAYDRGVESALPDGVRRPWADRANEGAFAGTVPRTSPG